MPNRAARLSCALTVSACCLSLVPSAAALAQGNVACWGFTIWEQCAVPSGLTNVRSIGAGGTWEDGFTIVAKADGTVVGWGDNAYGQLVPPVGLTSVVQVAVGEDPHSVALLANGRVVTWGADWYGGGLIYGTDEGNVPITIWSGSPQPGDPLRFAGTVFTQGQQVAAGRSHSAVLTRSGQIICWGEPYSFSGFGDPPSSKLLFGTRTDGTAESGFLGRPAQIRGAAIAAATRVVAGDGFTGVLRSAGVVECLQDYWPSSYNVDQTPPAGLPAVIELAGGYDHMAARLADGSVVCWGSNRYGESLGTALSGTPILTKPTGAPVRLGGQVLYGVSKIAVGSEHTLALLNSGKVVAWGRNNAGQSLGTTASGAAILGVANGQFTKVAGSDLVSVTALAAGEGHSVALIGSAVGGICPADLDGSGVVDFGDIALALLDFGPCDGCATDLDGSGVVDFGDIALSLLDFGPCTP